MGFHDSFKEGLFVDYYTGEAMTYSSWSGGEPNNVNGDENFLVVTKLGWNDRHESYIPSKTVCVRQDLVSFDDYATTYGENWRLVRFDEADYERAGKLCSRLGLSQLSTENDEQKMITDLLQQGVWSETDYQNTGRGSFFAISSTAIFQMIDLNPYYSYLCKEN